MLERDLPHLTGSHKSLLTLLGAGVTHTAPPPRPLTRSQKPELRLALPKALAYFSQCKKSVVSISSNAKPFAWPTLLNMKHVLC